MPSDERNRRVLVIGCGIIGLTSALRLRQAGFEVEIFTRELPADTTTAVAAGFWLPYKVGSKADHWAIETYEEYKRQLQLGVPGVQYLELIQLFREQIVLAQWLEMVDDFRELAGEELPSGFKAGYSIKVPLANPTKYLPWLLGEVKNSGVSITMAEVTSIGGLFEDFQIVVNCSGLGSRKLVRDNEVYPIRGQVQIIEPLPPSVNRIIFFQDKVHATYIVPRTDDALIGGTADENVWDLAPSIETAKDIRARCEAIMPEVRDAAVRANLVGLRPARKEVRLEAEQLGDERLLIHNYGHGGAGLTVCWGCANAVAGLVRDLA